MHSLDVFNPWWEIAISVAESNKDILFVKSYPILYSISKVFKENLCIIQEIINYFSGFPASILILQYLRQIPVIDRDNGFNIVFEKLINQIRIKFNRSEGTRLNSVTR